MTTPQIDILMDLGCHAGAAKLVEDAYGTKVAGVGCTKHSTERIHDAMYRHEFGRTTSPEEGFAKRTKAWFNKAESKTSMDVKKERERERERGRERERKKMRKERGCVC